MRHVGERWQKSMIQEGMMEFDGDVWIATAGVKHQ